LGPLAAVGALGCSLVNLVVNPALVTVTVTFTVHNVLIIMHLSAVATIVE